MRTRLIPALGSVGTLLAAALAMGAAAAHARGQCSGWIIAPYGSPGFNQRVTVLHSWDPDGPGSLAPVIVAGGDMTVSGTTALGFMAKWDAGANGGAGAWTAIGGGAGGTDAEVNCFATMPNGNLVAGGIFSNAGSPPVAALRVAQFNGTTWSGMGGGMNSAVWSMVVKPGPTPELYASGWFTQAGPAVTRVARWTGTAWAGVPPSVTGFNDWTWALAVLPASNTLVTAGAFSTYNGGVNRRIASFNGTTWAALGGGVNTGSEIYELFVMPNGDLIASGNFTQIGGVAARNVARFNGTTWSAMGAGFPLPARDFAVMPNGDLYAANVLAEDFTGPAIAKWDGTSWTRVATSDGTIFALLPLNNGDLLVGGAFLNVGGTPTHCVAVYRPPTGGAPQITQQPAGAVVCGPGSAAYSVGASGSGTLTYQWQWRRIGQTAWANVVQGQNTDGTGIFQSVGGLGISTSVSDYHEGGAGPGGAVKLEVRCTVSSSCASVISNPATLKVNSADFNGDGDIGTDADIEAYFACLSGNCCAACGSADFNSDGNLGTDADIESFFRVLGGGSC